MSSYPTVDQTEDARLHANTAVINQAIASGEAIDTYTAGDVVAVGSGKEYAALALGYLSGPNLDQPFGLANARRVPRDTHVILVFDHAVYVAHRIGDDGIARYRTNWAVNGTEYSSPETPDAGEAIGAARRLVSAGAGMLGITQYEMAVAS